MTVITEVTVGTLQDHEKAIYRTVLVESYLQYKDFYQDPQVWEGYLNDIRASIDNPNAEKVLVAKIGDEIVGGLQLFLDSEKAYGRPYLNIDSTIIRLLGVHPRGRRKGVAKKLLHESFNFARSRGDKALYLHSSDIMPTAIQLYLSNGFVRDTSKEFQKGDILVKSFRYDL